MPIELVVIVSIASGLGFAGCLIGWLFHRHKELFFSSFLCFMVFIGFITWLIITSQLPLEVKNQTFHKIVTTTYENGNKVQSVYMNDTVVKVSVYFGSVIIPDGKYLKKVTYKNWYNGIYYSLEKQPSSVFLVDQP